MTHGQLGPVSGAQPGKIGDTAQATLVLVQFEHKMITRKPLRETLKVRIGPRARSGGCVRFSLAGCRAWGRHSRGA